MTSSAVLKLMTGGRNWAPVRFSAYAEWPWVHEELGPEAREYVSPDGDWVLFVDGAFVYYVTSEGVKTALRLEPGW